MIRYKHILAAVLLTAVSGIGTLLPFSAQASENGRRNTTYGVGALTGALIYKHKWIPAAVAGVGTYAAYHNWQAQINARHRHQNRLARIHSYRSGYNYGVRSDRWHQRYMARHHARAVARHHARAVARHHRAVARRHYRAVAHRHHCR